MNKTEQTTALRDALGWTFGRTRTFVIGTRTYTERMLKRPGKRTVAIGQGELGK